MMLFNYMKYGLQTFVLLVSMIASYSVHAMCSVADYDNPAVTYTFPEIIVQRDLPVGSRIGDKLSVSGSYQMVCLTGGNEYLQMLLFPTASQYSGVYKTNIEGIGIKLGFTSTSYYLNPANTLYYQPNNRAQLAYPPAYLIKIGPTSSGKLKYGLLAKSYGDDNLEIVRLYLTSSNITTVACSINTPDIQVPLDSVQGRDLIAIGTTAKPKVFNLGLNCDAGTRINAKISGTQNTDTTTAGVLQLTNAGSSNVATGVGIQLLYNNQPITLGNKIVLKTSSGGVETFPFTAQYYQTKASPKAGSANAVATLDLTYE